MFKFVASVRQNVAHEDHVFLIIWENVHNKICIYIYILIYMCI